MNLALDLFLFGLVLVNTFIHSIGASLLIILYRKRKKRSTQEIYLINLSISEILLNFMEILKRIPEMFSHANKIATVFKYIQHYATVINLTGIWMVRYVTMIYITVDRLLMVRFGLKYQTCWMKKRPKYLIIAKWVICLSIPLCICVCEFLVDFHYQPVFYKYVFPTIDFGYIILAISVYSYMFYRHQKSYKMKNKYTKRRLSKQRLSTTTDAFVDSRFYTTILLVFSFSIFIIIPDLTYMFLGMQQIHFFHGSNTLADNQSDILFDLCRVSYAIASTIDFFIYIFIRPDVQAILCKKCHQLRPIINKKYKSRSNVKISIELLHVAGTSGPIKNNFNIDTC